MDDDEIAYLQDRAEQFAVGRFAGSGRSRREVLALAASAVPALTAAALFAPPAGARRAPRPVATPTVGASPIVKALPPEWFVDYGTNAEMRWDSVDFGHLTPAERFFVRDHTRTPIIDARTWRLNLFGTGLRGAPTADRPVSFALSDLLRLPQRTVTTAIECAGNGRRYFDSQQGTPAPGTQWGLGAVGVARWTGVPLSAVLARAGLSHRAVDVMPAGLDANVVTNGVDNGHVRRPFPIGKALDDVLLVHTMNGRPLPADHGGPVRVIVPGWVGVANIKWVGSIEVAAQPLFSTWNTTQYRLAGGDYPNDSPPLTEQVVKSAFELADGAVLRPHRRTRLRGRSWSGSGAIRRVDVSTDGGRRWAPARLHGPNLRRAWTQWEYPWTPGDPGERQLLARATDSRGRTQPLTVPFNANGYLFGAVVRHPVTVSER